LETVWRLCLPLLAPASTIPPGTACGSFTSGRTAPSKEAIRDGRWASVESTILSRRVLIVDDAVVMRMMIKGILAKSGFDVVGEAQNGVEAVEKYVSLRPDLVTMDVVMPEMDGIAAVKEILAHDPQARIVMCTSMGQQALVVEAIQAGAKSFITKPFQAPKIVDTLNKVLS
jgi:two-component system, chemotaxis family, chemotaxis protein CheY